jgi:hypothetical protein
MLQVLANVVRTQPDGNLHARLFLNGTYRRVSALWRVKVLRLLNPDWYDGSPL